MANKYAGEQKVVIEGKVFKVVYDWAAIAEAQSSLGGETLGKVAELGALTPLEIASLLVIGLKKHHPQMTAEKLFELSPPIVDMLEAIDGALALAFFGPEKVAADKKVKEKAIADNAKKKIS